MPRILDHIDLRVPDFQAARAFYEKLPSAPGFPERAGIPDRVNSNAASANPPGFFGFIEPPGHIPNENRIVFWTESNAPADAILPLLQELGAKKIGTRTLRNRIITPSFSKVPSATGWRSVTGEKSGGTRRSGSRRLDFLRMTTSPGAPGKSRQLQPA